MISQFEIRPFDLSERLPAAVAVMAAALGLDEFGSRQHEHVVRRHSQRSGLITRGAFAGDVLVGFCYGFPNDPAAFWEQRIRPHLVAAGTAGWLTDAFELTELHVQPESQGRGLGRRLLTEVLACAGQGRAILSVRHRESPARRLYRSTGFRELTAPFQFGAGQPAYVVMGVRLPLPSAAHSTG